MKRRNLPLYVNLLLQAQATGESRYPAAIAFNGCRTVEDYRMMMLSLEFNLGYESYLLLRLCQQQERMKRMVETWVWELEGMLSVHHPDNRHEFLSVSWDGKTVAPEMLPPKALEMLDSYLLAQRRSFLRQRNFLLGDKGVATSDYSLEIKSMELAEMLCWFYYTGIVKCHGSDRKEDFIRFFCAMWNMPLPATMSGMMLQTMSRENPVAFMDRLKDRLLKHIERRDAL